MNDKMVFGQYVNVDSWIHRLDPRTKIITLFSLMICLFLINNIYILLGLFAFELIIVISSKVPLNKFLNSFKMVSMLLVFTFFCQVLFNKSGQIVKIKDIELTGQFTLSIVSLLIGIILIVLYVFSKKMIKKFKTTANDAANLVNCLDSIKGSLIWLLFIEYDNEIRIRFRSRYIPVVDIAAMFGGGGHENAAGGKILKRKDYKQVLKVADEKLQAFKLSHKDLF